MADKKSAEAEETMNLGQMKKLTGMSDAKFKNPKNIEKLHVAGADLTGPGRDWKVTKSQMIAVGFLNEDGTPLPVIRRATSAVKTNRSRFEDIESNGDLEALDSQLADERTSLTSIDDELKSIDEKLAEVKKLEQKRRELTTRRNDVNARAKAISTRIEKVAAVVTEEAERIAKNAAYLEKLNSK